MFRRPLGTLAAIGLVWACRASPGDAQRTDSSPSADSVASAVNGPPDSAADPASAFPDSTASDALPAEPHRSSDRSPKHGPAISTASIARRVIRVLITPTRTQYWIDRGRQSGAEYELLRAFEESLNKKYRAKRHVNTYLVFVPTSRDALIPDLLAGRGDLAAGILTLTPERMAKVDGGGPFFRGVKRAGGHRAGLARGEHPRRPRGPVCRGPAVL